MRVKGPPERQVQRGDKEKTMGRPRTAIAVCLLPLVILAAESADTPAVIWYDGSRSPVPPGSLLSDNEGYWGDGILTGVEYAYERPPDNPADVWRDKAGTFGRRLLDGRPVGNWWTSVGISGPLVVTFDFKRTCTFREVAVDTRSKRLGITLEVASARTGPWQTVYELARADCPETQFQRLPLAAPAAGSHLRLTVQAEGITWLDEVLVWGDAEVSSEVPEAYRPVVAPPIAAEIAFSSIPGIAKTGFSDARYWDWQREIGDAARQPAVWSVVPTWDAITDRPLLPAAEALVREVAVVMARNETECVALALTNTTWEHPRTLEVTLSPFQRLGGGDGSALRGELRVAGAIPSRLYDVNVGPLFTADNLLPSGLLRRYLTNGAGIADFPRLVLSRAGSAVLWLSLTSAGAEPGLYEATVTCGGEARVSVRAEVLDVALPSPFVWLQTWSGVTSMFPFRHADRDGREVAYKQSLGVTAWNGWPTPGSVPGLARERGRTIHHLWGIGDYGHQLYGGRIDPAKLTAEDEAKIAELIRGHVTQAEELGLGYDDWYVELTDEPGQGNSLAYGALCRLIRKADPRVRIYCNPSFWVGGEKLVLSDEDIAEVLGPWYAECVDVSSPLYLLLRDRPRAMALFDAPRLVRGYYTVSTQSAKSERAPQVELYRRLAWDAFAKGWNGWGFYSYFAPRGNPWNDFDTDWYTGENMPDYQMVYPGPRGPVPTRPSEAVREGWEDYCLLTLLEQQGKGQDARALCAACAAGEPLTAVRERALRLAASR
jgi:hypothetical protein